jgi:hypothetical protein
VVELELLLPEALLLELELLVPFMAASKPAETELFCTEVVVIVFSFKFKISQSFAGSQAGDQSAQHPAVNDSLITLY